MTTIDLPGHGSHEMSEPAVFPTVAAFGSRTFYAAAHVVADPLADNGPGRPATLDWEATMAFRRHLWSQGLGVAEAMDTAQRGMGLDWRTTRELIWRTSHEPEGPLACGVGTDHLEGPAGALGDVVEAYMEQLLMVNVTGATPILMCSRALAAVAEGPEDYRKVYRQLLDRVERPVILHWLGPMFDPALTGYWGSADLKLAAESLLTLIAEYPERVEGVKVSLLNAEAEIAFRRGLPDSVVCYTGDDFNYPSLIAGDERGFSHALLGVFDPLARFASAAAVRLDAGDTDGFHAILDPTVPLARKIFETPTPNYKTGVVFLSWLCGHQNHFRMVGGLESARSIAHLTEVFVLADRVGLYPDPELAASRMRALLTVAGQ